MMFHVEKRNLIAIPKFGVLDFFLFLYFFTAHADQLSLPLCGLTFRINHLIALFLFLFFLVKFPVHGMRFDKKMGRAWASLACIFFLSCLTSFSPLRSFIFLGWFCLTLFFYVSLPILFFTYYSAKKVLTLYLFSFLCVGFYAALQGAASFFGIFDPFAEQLIENQFVRPNAFAYEPSYYALYMTPFVMMANLHYLLDKGKSFFIFNPLKGYHLFLINLLYVISTSTSCLFAYVIFFVIALFLRKKSVLKFGLYIVGLSLATLLLFPLLAQDFFLKFFFHGFMEHHSFLERWLGIINAWKIFLRHPFLGVGLGGVPAYLYQAWEINDPSFFYLSTQVEVGSVLNELKCFEPSNVLTEILASVGIFGALACALLFVTYFRQAKRSLAEAADEKKHWILLFLVSSLVMLVVLQFNQGLFRTYVWIHFSLAFALFKKSSFP